MTKNIHVVPHGDAWAIRKEGSERVSSTHTTQGDAIQQARTQAQQIGGEVFIHRPNGQIRDRDSYGNDPNPPKDTKN